MTILRPSITTMRQVDDAIKKFTAASTGDPTLFHAYRQAFEARIDELEDFHAANDDDERAVLFEKQRLRLRQALQTAAPPSPAKKDGGKEDLRTPASQMIRSFRTGVGSSPEPKSATLGSPSSSKSPKSASPRKKKQTTPKPLYSWEKKQSPQPTTPRSSVNSPHGEFIPSASPGFYEKRGAAPTSTKYIDFQVVLSEDSYQELLTRRRRQNAEAKHMGRFKDRTVKETPYLNASTPYVDPSKVLEGLWGSKR